MASYRTSDRTGQETRNIMLVDTWVLDRTFATLAGSNRQIRLPRPIIIIHSVDPPSPLPPDLQSTNLRAAQRRSGTLQVDFRPAGPRRRARSLLGLVPLSPLCLPHGRSHSFPSSWLTNGRKKFGATVIQYIGLLLTFQRFIARPARGEMPWLKPSASTIAAGPCLN